MIKHPIMLVAIIVSAMLAGGLIVGFVMAYCHYEIADKGGQVKGWWARLDEKHWVSGKPRGVRIDEPTYDAARKTAATRMHWQEKGFSVSPVVKDYVDTREVEYTP